MSLKSFLLERYAAGRLPAAVAARVARRVFTDESWARAYHELRVAERAVDGAAALSTAQMDRLTAGVLGASTPAPPARSPWRAGLFTLAGAAACAAVLLVVVRPGHDDTGFHARGGDGPKAGVHVRCVDASRQNMLGEADVAPGARLSCPRAGLLAFSATNTGAAAAYVQGVAVTDAADDAALFTLPFAGEPAFAVPAGSIDLPLPRGFPLAGVSGPIRLSAGLFAQAPSPSGPSSSAPPSSAPSPDGALVIEVTP